VGTARRPIAEAAQVTGLAAHRRDGAGTYTQGDVVTVGDDAYVLRADVGTTIVAGGAPNYENVVGGNLDHVSTAESNLIDPPTLTDQNGNWVVILGGYDNVVNGYACVVGGFHHKVAPGANHATVVGGSIASILADVAYATIVGGNSHSVTANNGTVVGGIENTVSGISGAVGGGSRNVAGPGTYPVVGGGETNIASGNGGVIGGGTLNQATANFCTVAGGTTNTATANNATVGGGSQNDATGAQATIAGGNASDASGQNSTVGGGGTNVASGIYSTVVGGYANVASADYTTAMGREASAARRGGMVQAAGKIAAVGDAQTSVLVARRQTTDATPKVLGLNATDGTVIAIPSNTSMAFSAMVVARRVDAGAEQSAAYKFEGLIKSDGTTVSFVGTPTTTVLGEDEAAWDCVVTANNTTKALVFTCTGAAGATINWVGRVTLVETTGAH